MKKITYTLFLLNFVFMFSSTVSADLIPPYYHSVDRCVKVVNLNEFPNVVLIGYITGHAIDKYEAYQILDNECLTKGYKFNSFNIYWTTKEKFNSIDLKNLNLMDINLLLKNFEPSNKYISDKNPLVGEDIEYSIAGFSNSKLVFYKSKQTSEYNNGNPKKIEIFNGPRVNIEPVPSSEPARRGFWQSVACFFNGLFSKGCQ